MPIPIDWNKELERSIVKNRLKIINTNINPVAIELKNKYNVILEGIINETTQLFNKANEAGKWVKSDAIKFNRNKILIGNINEKLKGYNKTLKATTKKSINEILTQDYSEVTSILNDFNLIDDFRSFQPLTKQFRDDILAQDVQGLDYLQRSNKISASTAQNIETQINIAQTSGESLPRTIARIRKVSNLTKQSAARLVHTYVLSASNNAHLKAYKDSKIIQRVRWSASLDTRTCPICGTQDGKTFDLETAPPLPTHFVCRCSYVPIIPRKEWSRFKGFDRKNKDLGRTRIARKPDTIDPKTGKLVKGKNFLVPANTTYRDYFRNLPDKNKIDIIGKGKFDLWEQGEIKFRQIAPQKKIVPLKTLEKRVK